MTVAERIKAFFTTIEEAWEAIPGYIKVFLYSTVTMVFLAWDSGTLSWQELVRAIAFNIGIYQIPRTIGTQTKKMLS